VASEVDLQDGPKRRHRGVQSRCGAVRSRPRSTSACRTGSRRQFQDAQNVSDLLDGHHLLALRRLAGRYAL